MPPFRPEVATRLAELAPSLFQRLDVMAERMMEVLQRTEPGYDELAGQGEEELRASIRANLEQGVRSLVDAAAGVRRVGVVSAREVGRHRAAQAVPLESVLRAYRLGGQVTWEALLEAAQTSGKQDTVLLEVAGAVWRTNDVECQAVAEGYREEQRRQSGVDEQEQQHVLDALLDGRGGDPAFVRAAADRVCVPLAGRLVVVVALAERDGVADQEPPGGELLRRGVRSLWGQRHGSEVGVLALGRHRVGDVLRWLGALDRGRVGVSDVVDGASGIVTAYRLAEAAARTLPDGARRVVTIDERLPEALLSSSPEISSRLVGHSLGGLLELPAEEQGLLLDTLAAVLACDGSPTRAADALYCHRNTVMHRLRRIEAVTGRRLDDPRARLLWQLALLGTEHRRSGVRRSA